MTFCFCRLLLCAFFRGILFWKNKLHIYVCVFCVCMSMISKFNIEKVQLQSGWIAFCPFEFCGCCNLLPNVLPCHISTCLLVVDLGQIWITPMSCNFTKLLTKSPTFGTWICKILSYPRFPCTSPFTDSRAFSEELDDLRPSDQYFTHPESRCVFNFYLIVIHCVGMMLWI